MIATCPQRELLRDYASGLVSENQADELTAHLRSCPSCQSWLSESADLDDTLIAQLRNCSTIDDSFQREPQCQSATARALGALASAGDASDDAETDLPSSIGDYEIVRHIGHGGMGNVYLAQHTRLDRTVAVKVLASHRLSDPRMHDRFQKEMRAIGSLSHPNIVTAYDARDVDGVAFLVTEWIDGLDANEIVRRVGRLSLADACEIGTRIASALAYISDQHLVHRDLKPSNVMIDRQGEVKLLDLGLARLRTGDPEHDATQSGQAMGTADYVAPEQISDARDVDIRADIYSLGCTLYKLLSGRAPFQDDRYPTAFSKLTAHVSETPAPLRDLVPDVPPAVANLVEQMIAKSPADRPTSPDEIAAVLQKHAAAADLTALLGTALESEPSAMPQLDSAAARPATKPFWKRRVPLSVAIASGLGGLILGLFAGVLITVTHPDGTITSVEAPLGSHTTVSEEGDIDIQLGGARTAAASQPRGAAAAEPDVVDPLKNLAPPDDSAMFEGVWQVLSVMNRGVGGFQWIGDHSALVFHGNDVILMRRSKPIAVGRWSIDSDLTQLTLTFSGGAAAAEQTYKSIYRFEPKGRLEVCMGDDKEFPKAFDWPLTSALGLEKVEFPRDPAAAKEFLEDPGLREMLHALAFYKKLQSDDRRGILEDAVQSLQSDNQSFQRTQSQNNLRRLGIAFHNYHDVYQSFPTSKCGRVSPIPRDGNPPISWRVAILPFLEHLSLFEQYRFDEPWDSDHNLTLLEMMPEVFRRPGDAPNSSLTGYVGFSGENTLLGGDQPTKMRDIKDGTSNTIMLVEAKTNIPWTKPDDFSLQELVGTGLLDNERILVSMADASIQQFQPVTAERMRQAVIINDGKK